MSAQTNIAVIPNPAPTILVGDVGEESAFSLSSVSVGAQHAVPGEVAWQSAAHSPQRCHSESAVADEESAVSFPRHHGEL